MKGVFFILLLFPSMAFAGRSEFSFDSARPEKKDPVPILIKRNPLLASQDTERPLPVLKDKDDPVTKVQQVLRDHVHSVIHQSKPLILVDGRVFRPGDEIALSGGVLIAKYRVVLKNIESDRLVLTLASLDPQQPGQVEAPFLLSQKERE